MLIWIVRGYPCRFKMAENFCSQIILKFWLPLLNRVFWSRIRGRKFFSRYCRGGCLRHVMLKVSPKVVDFFRTRGGGRRMPYGDSYILHPCPHLPPLGFNFRSEFRNSGFLWRIFSSPIDSMVKQMSLTRRCNLKAEGVLWSFRCKRKKCLSWPREAT